jgi:hypothetical protein
MKKLFLLLLLTTMKKLFLLLLLTACARSSPGELPGDSVTDAGVTLSPPRMTTAPPVGAIESTLFPPELVMENQGALGIDQAQRDALTKEIDKGQSERLRLQWALDAEKEKLVKLLDQDKVDEAKATEQAQHVMEQENRIKSAHLAMLIRVKNLLTPEQQKKLRDLRTK